MFCLQCLVYYSRYVDLWLHLGLSLSFLALWFTVWILLDWNGMDAIDHPVHLHEHGGGLLDFYGEAFLFWCTIPICRSGAFFCF